MLKILNVDQFVLYLLAVVFVIIGGKYRLRVKEGDKNKIYIIKNLGYIHGLD